MQEKIIWILDVYVFHLNNTIYSIVVIKYNNHSLAMCYNIESMLLLLKGIHWMKIITLLKTPLMVTKRMAMVTKLKSLFHSIKKLFLIAPN